MTVPYTFANRTSALPLSELDANFTSVSDASGVNFLQSGTGAVARTVQSKERDIVSVKDFGAVGDGVTDDTAAIQAAHDALGVNGGFLLMPIGTYLVSSLTISKQVTIQGQGMFGGGTYILASTATGKVFNITGSSVTIRDLCISKNVAQTGGAYVYCDTASSVINLENIYMLNWYRGVHFVGIGNISMRHLRLSTGVVTTGIGIRIDSGLEINMHDVIVQNANGSEPAAGMSVISSGDIVMNSCHFIENLSGLSIQPGASAVCASIYATNCFFDNSTNYGLLVQPTSVTGTVQRATFVSCWFSSSGSSGVLLDSASVGGTIDGFEFIGCEVYLNGSAGFQANGTGTKRIRINGGKFAQNTGSGLQFGANVSNWQVTNATIGAAGGLTGNTTRGITSAAGTSDDVLIANNQMTGNTVSAMNIVSTGSRRLIQANAGYNPVGTSAITVTASPFTYTAGDTPETVTLNTGTVSLVTVGGASVSSQTNGTYRLGPGVSMVVTYTVAPAMVKTID